MVTLVPITTAVAATLTDVGGFAASLGVHLGNNAELIRAVVAQNLAFLASVPRDDPWGGYLTIDEATRAVVGTCAFKTGPTAERTVEIAYYTFPGHEGRGFATAMVRELYRIAAESGQVECVIAHTLPEPNASNTLLCKVGFAHVGEVLDPEDGRVWRFERACDSRRGQSPPGV